MGNEASLEGGEGSLSELPEGISADGKGGFVRTSTGEKADLTHLSEEERSQLAAAMSRVPGGLAGCGRDAATSRQAFKALQMLTLVSVHSCEEKICNNGIV